MEGPAGVGKPTWRFGRGREGSESQPRGPGGVRSFTRRFGRGRGQPRSLGGVGSHTRRFGRGWEAHPKVREESEGPSGGPGEVGKGRECHPKVQEGFRGLPEGPAWVRSPTWMVGRGLQAQPNLR